MTAETAAFHDLDAERGFLAALALESQSDPGAARNALEQSLVTPERLYHPAHREVLEAIRPLLEQGIGADLLVLSSKLKASQAVAAAGGTKWLGELLLVPAYGPQIPAFADAIRAAALRRKLSDEAHALLARVADPEDDPAAALAATSQALAAITLGKRCIRTLSEVAAEVTVDMEAAARGEWTRIVPTGFPSLDRHITGWQPTLNVVGALPGVGKSALLASTVQAIAKRGGRVGVFSLEDEAKWLAWRFFAAESGIRQGKLRTGLFDDEQRTRVVAAAASLATYAGNVLVDDRSALEPRELVQTARDMVVNRRCQAIIVDHLGELRFEGRHRDRYDLELMEGLSDLREIAKRHQVPVIVAAHLKRRPGLGPEDVPRLDDFANSAAIERQARVALGLSRKPDSDELHVHVLKQTNGRAGVEVTLAFKGVAAMVRECEPEVAQ